MFYTVESDRREWVISIDGKPLMRCAVTEAAVETLLQFLEMLHDPLCGVERDDRDADTTNPEG